jgi:hypothetical protein
MKTNRLFVTVFTLCLLAAGAASLLCFGGCTKDIEGNQVTNERPSVWFVNVPPEGSKASINPIINWVGSDRDGQIDFFRYIVIREDYVADSLGLGEGFNPLVTPLTSTQVQTFVDDILTGIPDTLWTYLQVETSIANPQTSNIIPMQAEITSPVLVYVPQFVFVQAFDEAGLGSDVAFRRFLRNDNPPQTRIRTNPAGAPFINAPSSQGASTGIRLRWEGSDVLDYPADPPPLEYQWKLFGPYDSATYHNLIDAFEDTVFVTPDARVFRNGQPPTCDTITPDSIICFTYMICDTTFVEGRDSIVCTTILVDTITASSIYGTREPMLHVLDEAFVNSPVYNKVADSSDNGYGNPWVTDTRDSMFNVYWNAPSDTSVQMNFIFWVRSRDDARVPDLTPAYISFSVIDAKHERDVVVFDAQRGSRLNGPSRTAVRAYWDTVMTSWIAQRPDGADIKWDTAKDYGVLSQWDQRENLRPKFLKFLLSHKVVLLADEEILADVWKNQSSGNERVAAIYTALQTGVNVWVMTRSDVGNQGDQTLRTVLPLNARYQYFFGAEQMVFTGWMGEAIVNGRRIEDFSGTLTLNQAVWPALTVDTARIHKFFQWSDALSTPWDPSIACLPEVGWQIRSFDTEIQYLYKSRFGENEHFMGRDYTFSGRPVAHRLNRGLFRTAHWCFTPFAMEQSTMLPVVYDMLDWFYDGYIYNNVGSAAKMDLTGVTSPASVDELREKYWNAWWNANGDAEEFYRLLSEF